MTNRTTVDQSGNEVETAQFVTEGDGNKVELKPNQIWKTITGRTCIIVNALDEAKKPVLKMLWFDEIDQDLCVSDICNRLEVFLGYGSPSEIIKPQTVNEEMFAVGK